MSSAWRDTPPSQQVDLSIGGKKTKNKNKKSVYRQIESAELLSLLTCVWSSSLNESDSTTYSVWSEPPGSCQSVLLPARSHIPIPTLVKQSGCLSLCLPVCLLYILFTYCVFALVKSYSWSFSCCPAGRLCSLHTRCFVVVFHVQPFLGIGEVAPLCFCSLCEIGSWFPKIAHHKCGGGQETLKGPKKTNQKISPVLSLT